MAQRFVTWITALGILAGALAAALSAVSKLELEASDLFIMVVLVVCAGRRVHPLVRFTGSLLLMIAASVRLSHVSPLFPSLADIWFGATIGEFNPFLHALAYFLLAIVLFVRDRLPALDKALPATRQH